MRLRALLVNLRDFVPSEKNHRLSRWMFIMCFIFTIVYIIYKDTIGKYYFTPVDMPNTYPPSPTEQAAGIIGSIPIIIFLLVFTLIGFYIFYRLFIDPIISKKRKARPVELHQEATTAAEALGEDAMMKAEKDKNRMAKTGFTIALVMIASIMLSLVLLLFSEEDLTRLILVIPIAICGLALYAVINRLKISNEKLRGEPSKTHLSDSVVNSKIHPAPIFDRNTRYAVIMFVIIFVALTALLLTDHLYLEDYKIMLLTFEPFLFVIILMMATERTRYLRKTHIKTEQKIDIDQVGSLRIIKLARGSSHIFIVDKDNNLIYETINTVSMPGYSRYSVVDSSKNAVAEISFHDIKDEILIKIKDKEPMIIRQEIEMGNNFEIIGREYHIDGDFSLTSNYIKDKKDTILAEVSAMASNHGGWRKLGNSEVELYDLSNHLELAVIATVLTERNLIRAHHRISD